MLPAPDHFQKLPLILLPCLPFTSLHLSHSLFDRWGTKDDRATTVFHSSLFSAFRRASPNFNPVHSVMLSSHLFFCLPLLLPPYTVPCRIIFASPCFVPIPSQVSFLHSGEKIFIGPNGLSDSDSPLNQEKNPR